MELCAHVCTTTINNLTTLTKIITQLEPMMRTYLGSGFGLGAAVVVVEVGVGVFVNSV